MMLKTQDEQAVITVHTPRQVCNNESMLAKVYKLIKESLVPRPAGMITPLNPIYRPMPLNPIERSAALHYYSILAEQQQHLRIPIEIGLSYQLTPGQDQFVETNNFLSKESLSEISKSLNFSRTSMSQMDEITSSGLKSLETRSFLVQVISYSHGMYGRFLILVTLGVGCTVWYGFAAGGTATQPPMVPFLYTPLDTLEILNNPYTQDFTSTLGFQKMNLVENSDVSEAVIKVFPSLDRAAIPIALGIFLSIILTVGIVPGTNAELILPET